jgi:hypothetical protein
LYEYTIQQTDAIGEEKENWVTKKERTGEEKMKRKWNVKEYNAFKKWK